MKEKGGNAVILVIVSFLVISVLIIGGILIYRALAVQQADTTSPILTTTPGPGEALSFKDSLKLALEKAHSIDQSSILDTAEVLVKPSYDLYLNFVSEKVAKVSPLEGKDIWASFADGKYTVVVLLDGLTGQVKDSFKIQMPAGEEYKNVKGLGDVEKVNYGPDEIIKAIKTRDKFKEYSKYFPTNEPALMVLSNDPNGIDPAWMVVFSMKQNNVFYQATFLISAKDLSVIKEFNKLPQ